MNRLAKAPKSLVVNYIQLHQQVLEKAPKRLHNYREQHWDAVFALAEEQDLARELLVGLLINRVEEKRTKLAHKAQEQEWNV